ncbi:MAG: hypothetical protein ACM3ZC_05815 [Bacteroidota bacterium]
MTLAELKKRLRYEEVTEIERGYNLSGNGYQDVVFCINDPSRPDAPIMFGFDASREYTHFVGWMSWHTHFDDHINEDVNIAKAIAFIRKIIQRRRYLLQYFDKNGKYFGGSIISSWMLHRIATDADAIRDLLVPDRVEFFKITTFGEPSLRFDRNSLEKQDCLSLENPEPL